MMAMTKAAYMVIMALVLSLLALPAFCLRQEGALTFSNFKNRMNAHSHGITKLATINGLRPRALFHNRFTCRFSTMLVSPISRFHEINLAGLERISFSSQPLNSLDHRSAGLIEAARLIEC